jgi:hypothetical protein
MDESGFSLADLIQQSSTQNDDDDAPQHGPPEASRMKKREKNNKKRSRAEAYQDNSDDDDDDYGLDVFYGIKTEQQQQDEDETISKPAASRKPTRRRRRRDEDYQMTPEEIATEKEKLRKKNKYRVILDRWQAKTVNIQDEVDYGGAVRHAARLTFRKRKRERREQKENDEPSKRTGDKQTKDKAETEEELSSDEERRQRALGSLWTPKTQESAAAVSIKKDSEDEAMPSDAESETSQKNYWEQGYLAPRLKDLPDFYYGNYGLFRGIQWKEKLQRTREIEDEPVKLKPTGINVDGVADPQYYVQLPRVTDSWAKHGFFHRRTFRAMASRYLVGNSATNSVLSDPTAHRILTHLSSIPFREIGKEYLLMQQAKESGLDYILFQSYHWKERQVAAHRLGVLPGAVAPSTRVGYSLETDPLQKMARSQRDRLGSILSDGKIPQKFAESSLRDKDSSKNRVLNIDSSDDEDDGSENVRLNSSLELRTGERATKPAFGVFSTLIDASFFFEAFPSTCDFVHSPGSQPPTPRFPLDESRVMFGGVDKFCRIFHVGKMDEATFTIVLNSLLARLGAAQRSHDDNTAQQAESLLASFLNQITSKNSHTLSSMSRRRKLRTELPSKPLNIALEGLCGYIANSEHLSQHHFDAGHQPAVGQEDLSSKMRMDRCAVELRDRLDKVAESSSLTMFPRLHAVSGITLIARKLPAAAAEILSRPFDEVHHRTPFDLIRKTLEFLEANRKLVDSLSEEENPLFVNVRTLEHHMTEAARIWHQCIEMEPLEADYHAWYISGLSASLLLCSGNQIGSEARLYPSSKQSSGRFEPLFISTDLDLSAHEVRPQLQTFDTVRKDLAAAVRHLVSLTSRKAFARLHMVISALLEWKEVVALLVGPDGVSTEPWRDIERLHAHHTVQWALLDKSFEAKCRLKHLASSQKVTADAMLSMLATELEDDPGDIYRWRALVDELGNFGQVSEEPSSCNETDCKLCAHLRDGLNFDHASLEKRKTELGWWGSTRSSWWDKELLDASLSAEKRYYLWFKKFYMAIIMQLAQDANREPKAENGAAKKLEGVGPKSTQRIDLHWLDLRNDDDTQDEEISEDKETRAETYDSLLPSLFEDIVDDANRHPTKRSACLVPGLSSDDADSKLELLCYQLSIICHLYGPCHEVLREAIWALALTSFDKKKMKMKQCSEWQCLVWLYDQGLNVPGIVNDVIASSRQAKKR